MKNYRAIAAELKRRIRSGEYKVSAPLPSRMSLLKEFGVARSTLDRAMAELQSSGDIISRRGSGTYANAPSRYRIGIIGRFLEQYLQKSELPLIRIPDSMLEQRSEHDKLKTFDALLWMQPNREQLKIAGKLQDTIPQLILNRQEDGFTAISFDHRQAYKKITLERLEKYPDCIPVFLQQQQYTLPVHYRLAGFTDACREKKCFYEICRMPDDFEGKIQVLRQKLAEFEPQRPVVLVSDSLGHTGAVMALAREQQWQWQKTHLYSDADNFYPVEVWGVQVTSFRQDHFQLIQDGVERIQRMLAGDDDGELTLIEVDFCYGDT
ncbi:MAG: GntR family transcriptional regulator [Lentisphaerae bacterium]|nr:GntR family transcriptional regulator [Lentisphaerota bacterium]